MASIITKTDLALKLFRKGKVRDTYEYGSNLLMISTDRLSAFDVVFEEGVPNKGAVLTGMSVFWFDKIKDIVKNHLVSKEIPSVFPSYLQGRALIVKKAEVIKAECIVRGYLSGSGLKEYQSTGKVCGIDLPASLQNSSKLPYPIFTPSTKADSGHDENITEEQLIKVIGEDYHIVKNLSLRIYERAAKIAEEKGIILADTKFEFGKIGDEIILIDEALTPDSSRYWPKDTYKEGENQPSLDKQYVRDYLETLGWNKLPPPPHLPQEVVLNTSKKYMEIFERLTGKRFEVAE
ncbi:phosphoribosylaminoimidazolesuccinocarboxamide synthase [Candidatus Micrarchaeota archaeon CG1_02_47_40]|nr:MAG: phosphoribosylaminoimidazolesuccinocarboxamide synthase [Candidatus Micrarchaeota archaeon CG1_02_47_40]